MTDPQDTTGAAAPATPKRTPVPSPRATAEAVVGLWIDFGDPLEPLSDFDRGELEAIVRVLVEAVEAYRHAERGDIQEIVGLWQERRELREEVGHYRRQPVPPEPPVEHPPRGRRIQL